MGAIMEKTVAPKVIDDLMPLLEKAAAHHGKSHTGTCLPLAWILRSAATVMGELCWPIHWSCATAMAFCVSRNLQMRETSRCTCVTDRDSGYIQVGSSPSFAPMPESRDNDDQTSGDEIDQQ